MCLVKNEEEQKHIAVIKGKVTNTAGIIRRKKKKEI